MIINDQGSGDLATLNNKFGNLTILNTNVSNAFSYNGGQITATLPVSTHNEICNYGIKYAVSQSNGRCIRSILIEWTQLVIKKVGFNGVSIVMIAIFKILRNKYKLIFQNIGNVFSKCNVLCRYTHFFGTLCLCFVV